jgi:hypothetical protein
MIVLTNLKQGVYHLRTATDESGLQFSEFVIDPICDPEQTTPCQCSVCDKLIFGGWISGGIFFCDDHIEIREKFEEEETKKDAKISANDKLS